MTSPCSIIVLDAFQDRYHLPSRPVGARGTMVPPDFGRSVNPISTRGGADYAHHITTAPSPYIFSDGPDLPRQSCKDSFKHDALKLAPCHREMKLSLFGKATSRIQKLFCVDLGKQKRSYQRPLFLCKVKFSLGLSSR